jgi:beta-phosphoglucomutase family hydrolase
MAEKIIDILKEFHCKAVIFDLDGTILDNNAYHLQAWKQYLKNIGREMTDEEYKEKINGRTNRDVVKYLYGDNLTEDEIWKYTMEKEALYRKLYEPHIAPVKGLLELLEVLDKHHIPMAIATSGIKVNIDFMFDHVPIKKYFKKVVDSSHITKGKPDPEVFLTTASFLGVSPEECLVFEDAVVGIIAAKAAGMRVIAVATTLSKEELISADLVINDYTELL